MSTFSHFPEARLSGVSQQGVRNNTANLRGLVTAITKLLKLLNDQIQSYEETVSKDAKFIQLFNEFNS